MNKPIASRPVMREVFAKLGLPDEISYALIDAAAHSKKRHPEEETMAQMFVSVATEQGVEALKIVVNHPFRYDYLKRSYANWHGIKAAKARKLLKKWSAY